MNILTQGFIRGLEGFITAKSDLDRLKHMPQRVEEGRLVNFKGHKLTAKIDGLEDFVIMDADKVNDAKRFTSALLGTYLEGFSKLQGVEDDESATTENTNNEPTLEDLLLDAVEAGDKKEVRNICKQLKEQWFALDDDVVEDAIDDIKDCVADKDVKAVEDILNSLEEPEQEEVIEKSKSAPELVKEIVKEETPTNNDEDIEDLLLDIQDAIKDEDIEDVELLLKELGTEHPRYKEFSISLATLKGEDAVIEPETNEIDDIIADLEDAIKDNDIDGENGAKVILEELKELVGEDDEDYIHFNKIVNPTTTRRNRRERRGK